MPVKRSSATPRATTGARTKVAVGAATKKTARAVVKPVVVKGAKGVAEKKKTVGAPKVSELMQYGMQCAIAYTQGDAEKVRGMVRGMAVEHRAFLSTFLHWAVGILDE